MNKYTLLALIWFILGIYGLIFREAGNSLPLFPHFDKVAHFALFFVQILLLAIAFIKSRNYIPYFSLFLFALLYAFGSELGQTYFTQTREGSWLDGIADMLGAGCALFVMKYYKAKKC
ncbi:VanZ family protein [Mannheimia sp. AT1]|uniref:VanZ family protein n=1 Tax=Mannheimia cairinae TaxID=3025936 RepID=A0ABT5ML86_9PAST|nr:VanZ family protein [Mannheimia cairinae]MDD0822949.1 VanZ family protein [Mannheimia cairinae]MDD0826023.1 VanZ family protein [Mannheimia cairinae]